MQPRERLTTKELQVAALVWEGLTNREIARAIGTTEQVVKNYLRNTFDKLGVWSRLELAIYVAAHGGAGWQEEISSLAIEAVSGSVARPVWPSGKGQRVQNLAAEFRPALEAFHEHIVNKQLNELLPASQLLFPGGA